MTLAFVDRGRPTVSRGQTVSGQRALTTLVWYPKSSGRSPLVIFAHGFQVGPKPYEHLCRAWAAAGYAVAANPPLLIAQGDEDTVNPPATGRSVYEQSHRPRFLVSLLGGGHMAAFLAGTRWQAVVDKMTVDFLDRYLSGRTSTDTALLRDADPGASSLVADP